MPGQKHQINLPGPAADAPSAEHCLVRYDHQGGTEPIEW